MKTKKGSSSGKPPRPVWTQALDQEAYQREIARVWKYLRCDVRKFTLSEAARRSGISRQFWTLVESGDSFPCTYTEVLMCNGLQIRPSVVHRLAERRLRRALVAAAA